MVDGSTPGRNSRGSGEPPAGPPSGPLKDPTPPDRPPPRRAGSRTLLLVLVGVIVGVVGVVGILAGAGAFEEGGRGDETESSTPPIPSPPASTPTPTATPTPSGRGPDEATPTTPTTRAPDPADGVLAFGATHRYEDGVEVTVSAPVRFTPSAVAVGHQAGHTAVTVQVTVRNGTDQRLELALVQVSARDGDGREASRIFDVEPALGSGLTGGLLSGRKAVAAYGFDVPQGKGVVLDVEVRIGFEMPSAFWGGAVR